MTTYDIELLPAMSDVIIPPKAQKNFWGFTFANNSFINLKNVNKMNAYVPMLGEGRYLVFFADIPTNKKLQDMYMLGEDERAELKSRNTRASVVGVGFGLIGGIVNAAATRRLYIPFIVDCQEETVRAFSSEYMEILKERHPEISSEMEEDDYVALLDYFNNINEQESSGGHYNFMSLTD